jgi:hypothetical protein
MFVQYVLVLICLCVWRKLNDIIIGGAATLVRTLTASHWRFRNLLNTLHTTTFDE